MTGLGFCPTVWRQSDLTGQETGSILSRRQRLTQIGGRGHSALKALGPLLSLAQQATIN